VGDIIIIITIIVVIIITGEVGQPSYDPRPQGGGGVGAS
jgi:hypothetical protein